jgi:hypothetical protein
MSHAITRIDFEVPMSRFLPRRLAAMCAALLVAVLPAQGHAQQQTFPTAEAAAEGFVDAVARSDGDKVRAILGADYKKVLQLDEVSLHDKLNFLEAWAKTHRVVERGGDTAVLEVGETNWSLPVPMVKKGDAWVFDTRAGAEEMKTRRIGRNELSAMDAAMAYFDAQKEYASAVRQPGQGLVYAQKFRSSPGKMDGLYWPTGPGEAPSPIGAAYAATTPDGAYHGYFFRILTAQGPHAPGGAYDYRSKGRMNAGFALIAWPARWGETGIMSFIVSHDGVLYEKNLGPNTTAVARGMQRFDPDDSWRAVQAPSQIAAASGK